MESDGNDGMPKVLTVTKEYQVFRNPRRNCMITELQCCMLHKANTRRISEFQG